MTTKSIKYFSLMKFFQNMMFYSMGNEDYSMGNEVLFDGERGSIRWGTRIIRWGTRFYSMGNEVLFDGERGSIRWGTRWYEFMPLPVLKLGVLRLLLHVVSQEWVLSSLEL